MKTIHAHLVALFIATLCIAPAFSADDRASPEEAVSMVKKAITLLKKNGKEKALSEFVNPQNKDFHDRDLYVDVYDQKGVAVTHENNPKMIGKNLIDMQDVDGKFIIKGFIDVAN